MSEEMIQIPRKRYDELILKENRVDNLKDWLDNISVDDIIKDVGSNVKS